MGKFKDLTGQKFGKWNIIKYAGKQRWLCRCDCGVEAVLAQSLVKGTSTKCKRCGYDSNKKYKINIGDRLGSYTAISEIYKKEYEATILPVVLLKCDCGEICEVIIYNLFKGGVDNKKCHKCSSIENAKLGTEALIEIAKDKRQYIEHDYYYEMVINNNQIVIFDKIDYNWIKEYTWRISNEYVVTGDKGEKHKSIHRELLQKILSRDLKNDEYPDHINRNPLDNRRCNIQLSNIKESNQNRGLFKNNTSGVKGVSFNDYYNKWQSYIRYNNKNINLGLYENKNDAVNSRLNAENKYWEYTKNLKERNLYIDDNKY